MNIAFYTKALRGLSESATLAQRKLGKEVAEAFHAALADVEAAHNPEELPLGFLPSDESTREFFLPLVDQYLLIFASNHGRDREVAAESTTDWRRVSRVKLMRIVRKNG